MTNQACVACRQNDIGKARELLLLANSCKGTEVRHESIGESIDMLQAARYSSLTPFTLPQHLIFRPSPKVVNQLRKKDYLGKSKVLCTENTEEIYACFSGIKAQREGKVHAFV